MRRVARIVACVVILAATGCNGPATDALTVVATKGDFERVLAVRGQLAAVETLNVLAEANGRISFMTAEGTLVKAGDPLFGLETKEMEDRLQQAGLDLAVAQAGLARAEEDIRSEKVKVELSLEEKTKQLEFNRLSADISRQDLVKKQRQIEAKILPRSELSPAELAVQQADLQVANAEIDLRRQNEEIASRKQTLELDRRSAQARLQKAQSEVDEAQDFLTKATAKAPREGVVVHSKNWRGQTWKVGDEVWQNAPVMELPNLSAMQVEMQVNEVDIADVKIGQAARVGVDAFPDLSLQGSLKEISGLATEVKDKDGNGTGLRVFDAKVALAAQDARMRPGMTARVELILDRRTDVVLVPTGAIGREGNQSYVTLAAGGRRDVVVAGSNPDMTAITQGVTPGDVLLVLAAASAGPSTPAQTGDTGAAQQSTSAAVPVQPPVRD